MILLGTLDDGGVFSDVYKDIYHAELQFKVEHSGNQATLLNLDITVKNGMFVYKPFFIIHTPYIDSNIPKSIFYSVLVG